MIPKGAEKAIAEHFEVPPDIQRLANHATWDLYHGPECGEDDEGEEDYPGFEEACGIVSDWCDDVLHDVWYDNQCGSVLDREPEGYDEECFECSGSGEVCFHDAEPEEECPTCGGSGEVWVEPEWEDFYHFEVTDVKRALFDKELVAYI